MALAITAGLVLLIVFLAGLYVFLRLDAQVGIFFLTLFSFAQFATYIMAIVRWFITDNTAFWHEELIWALIPVVNFTYVWDWWFGAITFVVFWIHAIVTDFVENW